MEYNIIHLSNGTSLIEETISNKTTIYKTQTDITVVKNGKVYTKGGSTFNIKELPILSVEYIHKDDEYIKLKKEIEKRDIALIKLRRLISECLDNADVYIANDRLDIVCEGLEELKNISSDIFDKLEV